MKRGKRRVTITGKMEMETRGEGYWDNWAQRRALVKREGDANATRHCACIKPCIKWPECKPKVALDE